jgi:hypothetical protein
MSARLRRRLERLERQVVSQPVWRCWTPLLEMSARMVEYIRRVQNNFGKGCPAESREADVRSLHAAATLLVQEAACESHDVESMFSTLIQCMQLLTEPARTQLLQPGCPDLEHWTELASCENYLAYVNRRRNEAMEEDRAKCMGRPQCEERV